jgi:hypothetical protein
MVGTVISGWNNGMMEYWNVGFIPILQFSLFQYSNIPSKRHIKISKRRPDKGASD